MAEATTRSRPAMRYQVFELSALGAIRLAGEYEAISDADALRQARKLVPCGTGELRHGYRVVCRFGRA